MKKHDGLPYFFGVDDKNYIYFANYRYVLNYNDLKKLKKACNKALKMYRKKRIFKNQIDEFNDKKI